MLRRIGFTVRFVVPIVVGILNTPGAHPQSLSDAPALKPTFDVVSIKPNHSGNYWSTGSPLQDKIGRYKATNVTLRAFISWWFGVTSETQIVGGPGWLDTDRYDIEAQVDGQPSRKELIQMLQSLVEDRFQLQFHRESRPTSIYVLLAPKNGLKLGPHLAKADDRDCSAGPPDPPGCRAFAFGPQGLVMEHTNFAGLANTLSSMLRKVVTDETGLTGRYDIKLELEIPSPQSGSAFSFGDLVTDALRDQTGVQLESRKRPTDVIVIDDVQKPSEN